MARGNDPGKDFDDQYYGSRREAKKKAARGESHWAQDKYLERNNERLGSGPAHHARERKSCGEKTVVLMAFLGGLGWAFAETVQYIV